MRNKKVFVIMIAFLLLGVLVACTDKTTTTPTTAAPTTTAPVTTLPPTTTAPTTTVTTEAPLPTTLDLLADLKAGNEGVYNLVASDTKTEIAYNKHGFAWPSLDIAVTEDISRFNKLTITGKGEGVLLVRLVGETESYEVRFALTSGEVSRQINIRDLDDFLGTVTMISLIAEPGQKEGRGSFELTALELDEGTAFGTVLEVKAPVYNTNIGWVELDADTYDFVYNVDKSVTVNYTKGAGQGWIVMKTDFDPALSAGYNTMTVTVSGTAGKSVLLKPNDNGALEKRVDFTDSNPVTVVFQGTFTKMIIFAEPGTESVSGTFTVNKQELSYQAPVVDYFDSVDFTEGWVANDPSKEAYTISFASGKTTIAWDREASEVWESVKYVFPSLLEQQNVITMTFKGEAGKAIIVKPNGNNAYEKFVWFDGTDQTVTFKLNEPIVNVIINVDPDMGWLDPAHVGSLTGTFDIVEAKTSYVFPGNLVETDWTENDPDTYDFTAQADGSILVSYNKGVGQGWVFMRNNFEAAAAEDMNLMLVVLQGTVGKSVLLKPNDSGALEKRVDFFNDQPVFVWVNADAFTNMIVFAEPGDEAVSGTFTILGVYLTYEQPSAVERDVIIDFESGWVDNGDSVYTITEADGKTTVAYDKGTTEWSTMKYTFTQNLSNHNLVTLVVKGTSGKQILVKLNNQYETWVTFDGTEQTVEIPLTYTLVDALIFAEGGVAGATGSFEIISATVSWVPVPQDITTGWLVNDAGTYTLVENVDGSITITYATTSYQFIINNFDAEKVLGLNTLTVTVLGTSGETLLIKPNDSGALEQVVTFDGTEQTFTYTSTGFTKLLLFAAPGAATLTEGTFTLVSVTLTYVAPEV